MEKLRIQHGGIMTTSMNIFGLLSRIFMIACPVRTLNHLSFSFAIYVQVPCLL